MPIVVLLFCRSHCPRPRRCLKLPNEQPECRHIELFPLKEHLSSLDQCKVFVVETLQDTHLLIHGSSSWTSFWFIHVVACHCKFAKFQQQTVVVVNLFKLKWRSITWKLKVCIHQTPKFVVKIFFFSVFSATQLIIFFFCMCLLHISWTNFALKRETQFQSQCLPNMLQLRHLDSFIIAHITPDNIKL